MDSKSSLSPSAEEKYLSKESLVGLAFIEVKGSESYLTGTIVVISIPILRIRGVVMTDPRFTALLSAISAKTSSLSRRVQTQICTSMTSAPFQQVRRSALVLHPWLALLRSWKEKLVHRELLSVISQDTACQQGWD